jgi:hypothetical protein
LKWRSPFGIRVNQLQIVRNEETATNIFHSKIRNKYFCARAFQMVLPNDIGHAEYLAPSGRGKAAFGFMAKLRDNVRQIPSAPTPGANLCLGLV